MNIVTIRGPLFDGVASAEAAAAVTAVRQAVSEAGVQLATSYISNDIRSSPTGQAERSVTMTNRGITYHTGRYSMPVTVPDPVTDTVVTTSLATYGPWLEGTGSRNQTTRFKGYGSFRRAAQHLQDQAEVIAESVIAPAVRRMNA